MVDEMRIKTAELFTSFVIMLDVSSEHNAYNIIHMYCERCTVYSQLDTGYTLIMALMPVRHNNNKYIYIYVFYVLQH